MRQLTLVLTIVVAVGCSNHDEKPPSKSAPQEFKCLKVSGGPGVGRECVGPDYGFTNGSADDVYSVKEAWCLTQRVSWANPHSMMRCAATEEDCTKVMSLAPNGQQSIFLRTPCVRTTPEAWTMKEAEYSIRDAFSCTSQPRYDPKNKNATIDVCRASPAEILDRRERIVDEAWCFEGADKGRMFNMHCYLEPSVCADEAVALAGEAYRDKCTLTGVQEAITAEFGHLDSKSADRSADTSGARVDHTALPPASEPVAPEPPLKMGARAPAGVAVQRNTHVPSSAPVRGDDDCDGASCGRRVVLELAPTACCKRLMESASTSPSTSPQASVEVLPEQLDRHMISVGIAAVKGQVIECGASTAARGRVTVHITVRPDGSVSNAGIEAEPQNGSNGSDPALGNCVAEAMRKATFTKTKLGGTFRYPFVF